MRIAEIEIEVIGKAVKTASLKREWLEDVKDPESMVKDIKASKQRIDLFTFWQRVPEVEPKHGYYMEWDNWAVLRIVSYENWFGKQINHGARTSIKKALKKGIDVKLIPFSDEFVRGVMSIFDETPIRQGRKYSHHGKGFEAVKAELSTEIERTEFIGAYYENELIGFVQQVYVDDYAFPFGGVSKISHRDKSPNNALLAKAVERCSKRGVPHLVYGKFDYGPSGSSLSEFKAFNGFEKVQVPRYFIPLTTKGKIVLYLKLHHGIQNALPTWVTRKMLALRRMWNQKRWRQVG